MPDQNQLDPFLTAKAEAEARRQETIRMAHEAFSRAYLLKKGAARSRVRARASAHGML